MNHNLANKSSLEWFPISPCALKPDQVGRDGGGGFFFFFLKACL